MSDETAWLIENRTGPHLHYFAPTISKMEGIDVWEWTKDHLEAVRFSRRIDAEKMLVYLRIKSPLHDASHVVEHMWCSQSDAGAE